MYTIMVVGAGYVGSRIASYFAEQKQRVYAVTRSEDKKAFFENQGIQHMALDFTEPIALGKIPPAHFIIFSLAPDESTEEAYRHIYVNAVRKFFVATQNNPQPTLVLYLSSTGVWRDQPEGDYDEASDPEPENEKSRILVEAENKILNCGFPSIIFRLSGIYGPGRNRLKAFEENTWPSSDMNRYMNHIHVEDIVGAVRQLMNKGEAGQVYVGVDDEPVSVADAYSWLCTKTGKLPRVQFGDVCGKRYSNQKLKALGYEFQYPTYREGYKHCLDLASDSSK